MKRDDNSTQIKPELKDGGVSGQAEPASGASVNVTDGSATEDSASLSLSTETENDVGVVNASEGRERQDQAAAHQVVWPPDVSYPRSGGLFKKKSRTSESDFKHAFDELTRALTQLNSREPNSVNQIAVLAEKLAEDAAKAKKRAAIAESSKLDEEAVGEVRSKKVPRDAKYIAELIDKHQEKGLEDALKKDILAILSENPEVEGYEVVFLYDHDQITRYHANIIYQKLSSIATKKDIFLILRSPGGEVEPAYLISKMCNRFKLSKFVVGIPADAKSAATLLSLGADELHMGAMSELGPIDPQINGFPALAFSGALERITKLASLYPEAAEMLSQYLTRSSLDVRALGHYERITESATQYALRLLKSKVTSTDDDHKRVSALAGHFTNHYKDHNFVIDMDEACELLGGKVVKADTALYNTCHEVHRYIDLFHQVAAVKNLDQKLIVIGDNFVLSP